MKVQATAYHGEKSISINPNALPTITLGYSVNDTKEYRNSHSTICGTLKPFMRNGGLIAPITKKIIEIVELTLRVLPQDHCFNLNSISNEYGERDFRMKMIADLKQFLGGNRDTTHFRVEGIAIIIPLTIGYHTDTLNCDTEGMKSVVSLNANVPINDITLPSNHTALIKAWLGENGYHESFPCSIILYSRSSVGSYVEKKAKMRKMAITCSLRRSVGWALMNQVGTVVDYLAMVFNSDDFVRQFEKHAKNLIGAISKGGC